MERLTFRTELGVSIDKKEDGDDDCGYLDITYKRLNEYFERIA